MPIDVDNIVSKLLLEIGNAESTGIQYPESNPYKNASNLKHQNALLQWN